MASTLKVENFFDTVIASTFVNSSGDVSVQLGQAPTNTKGFIIFSPDNANLREIAYYDSTSGTTINIKGINRINPKEHSQGETARINDVAELFNYFSGNTSHAFYIEKLSSTLINVFGGNVMINGTTYSLNDTQFSLPLDGTYYIGLNVNSGLIEMQPTIVSYIIPRATVVKVGSSLTITYSKYDMTVMYGVFDGVIPPALVASINDKLDKVSGLRTSMTPKAFMVTDASGNEGTITGTAGQVVGFDGSSNPIAIDIDYQSKIGTVSFTLGETLSTGDIVSIDNNTGKIVKTIVQGNDNTIASAGGSLTFNQVVVLSATTVVFFGSQSNNTIYYARAGTISGNTITLGPAVNLFAAGGASSVYFGGIVALDATTFVVGYEDKSTTSYIFNGIVATVSGTTITAGSPVVIKNSTTNPQTGWAVTKVTSTKVAFHYSHNSDNKIGIGTISGTVLTLGTEQGGFSIAPTVSCNVANDKYVVCDGANVRLYTTSGTVVTEGNNLALGVTYTNFSVRDLGSSKAIYCGTNGGTTFAFILDISGTTPVQGTIVTILAASTSNDCFKAGTNKVGVATGNNKIYFYTYSGTTLTFENLLVSTSSIGGYNSTNYLSDNFFVTNYVTGTTANGYVISNRPYYSVGILQLGGVLNDVRSVKISGGISTIHSSLTAGFSYYITNSGLISGNGNIYIGKALSSTSVLVAIPYHLL